VFEGVTGENTSLKNQIRVLEEANVRLRRENKLISSRSGSTAYGWLFKTAQKAIALLITRTNSLQKSDIDRTSLKATLAKERKLYDQLIEYNVQGVDVIKGLVANKGEILPDIADKLNNMVKSLKSIVKNSRNSSKRPSSDSPADKRKYPKRRKKEGKPGGKEGHIGVTRPPVTKVGADRIITVPLDDGGAKCRNCGHELTLSPDSNRLMEQFQLVAKPILKVVYELQAYWCPKCKKFHYPDTPLELNSGILSSDVITLMVGLKAVGHCSISSIQKLLSFLGADPCRATIESGLQTASLSVATAVEELKEAIPGEVVAHSDETSNKENGKIYWVWGIVCATLQFVYFHPSVSRASDVLVEIFTKLYDGIIVCDFYGAYKKYAKQYPKVTLAFCWAHLSRDIEYIAEKYFGGARDFALALLEIKNKLFHYHHLLLEDPDNEEYRNLLIAASEEFKKRATENIPKENECQNIAKRFLEYSDNYFLFVYDRRVPPTNNRAEQSIRTLVIDRVVTFGTRSINGRLKMSRLWTVIATCQMRGINPLRFFGDSLRAYHEKREAPSLLNW
jgi:hypothetical protein